MLARLAGSGNVKSKLVHCRAISLVMVTVFIFCGGKTDAVQLTRNAVNIVDCRRLPNVFPLAEMTKQTYRWLKSVGVLYLKSRRTDRVFLQSALHHRWRLPTL